MIVSARDLARILPTKIAVERKLIALPGITGVDIALKIVGGVETAIPCILVFVAKKGQFAPGNEIPRSIGGIPTDVQEAVFTHLVGRPGIADADEARYDPCQGGCSTAPARFADWYGTIGMLVTDSATGDSAWLSNYHIFCNDAGWSDPGIDRNITQQALVFGGTEADDTIGQVLRGVYGQVEIPWGYDLYVDCAICSVGGRATDPNVIKIGAPVGAANAVEDTLVTKYGATSERTTGLVVSTNFTTSINGTTFYYQYRVGPPFAGAPSLGQPGDSGSAVFDSDFNVIGLIMAGSGTSTIVNPIGQIIGALNISVP